MRTNPRLVQGGLLAPGLLLLGGLALSGCDDPICALSNTCFTDGTGGALGVEAFVPALGFLLESEEPDVLSIEPSIGIIGSSAPIAIFFTESMAGETLDGAFSVTQDAGGFQLPLPVTQVLVANGRGLLLLPQTPMQPANFVQISYVADNGPARDLTGQELQVNVGTQIGSFTVATADPVAPRVIAQWPPDGAINISRTTEILTVFDRPMDPDTFDEDSYAVTIGGADPDPDPDPQPLQVDAGFGIEIPDARVWVYERLAGDGTRLDFGELVDVDLALSSGVNLLLGSEGGELANVNSGFRTMAPAAPSGALLTSSPADAIGTANLVAGDSEAQITVQVVDAQDGDLLEYYLFGQSLGDTPQQVAVARQVTIEGVEPITEVVLGLADLDLTDDDGDAIFADGGLFAAFALRRNGITGPVGLLDLEPASDAIIGVAFDTTPPEVVSLAGNLVAEGEQGFEIRGEFRDLVLVGTANEEIVAADIESALGQTADAAPLLGGGADGGFITAGVPLGVLSEGNQGLLFELVLYDRALNASEPISGTFRQVGAIGPDPLLPGGVGLPIEVEVVDAETLSPLEGARVFTHADAFGTYPLIGSSLTDSNGLATVTSATTADAGTLLTVELVGYDLLTLHGIGAARASIPLRASGTGTASLSGQVTSTSPLAPLVLPQSDLALSDTRLAFSDARLFAVEDCEIDPFNATLTCQFGPQALAAARFGAGGLFVGDFDLPLALFTPPLFLQVAQLEFGLPVVDGVTPLVLEIDNLAADPGAPPEAQAILGPAAGVSSAITADFDFDTAIDVGPLAGIPDITIDVALPGLRAPLTVGLGLAYELGPGAWVTRSAYSGDVPALLEGEVLDDRLHLGVEFRNDAGALTAVRLPFSTLPGQTNTLFPSNVAVLDPALENTSVGAGGFTIEPFNALPNALFGVPLFGSGLYEVEIVDSAGRAWILQRDDLSDDAFLRIPVHAPDLGAAGGIGLADGELTVRVRSAAWPTFESGNRLLSDTLRDRSYYAETAVQTRQRP